MAVSAEPPGRLDEARRGIDDLGREVTDIGRWERTPDDKGWCLGLALSPDAIDATGPIPATTRWFVTVADDYPAGDIKIWPAKVGGITETFPHQSPNDTGEENKPWRSGWICVADSVRGHKLAVADVEPRTSYHRLVWHVWRALEWLRRASRNELLKDGEPFEMPVFGQYKTTPTAIAFIEGPETFDAWSKTRVTEGIADLVEVVKRDSRKILLVSGWRDLTKHALFAPRLGTKFSALAASEMAVWIRFDRLLKRPPWRAPQTWQEIREFAAEGEPDFDARLRRATSPIRDGKSHYILMGFPVSKVMGEEPSVFIWVAFKTRLEPDKVQKTPVNGFRTQKAAWVKDRQWGVLTDETPVEWLDTLNWHPDELATRGRFNALVHRKVLLIGAGALGSILAETIVRGGVLEIAVMDPGDLEAGNLVRHRLTMADIEAPKATALANRLAELSPSVRASGYAQEFPPTQDLTETRASIGAADVVIDTTGSPSVAEAMAKYEWDREVVFVSASLSFGAGRLYLYTATGRTFPVADFNAAIEPWLAADERPIEDFPHEGTGCFSPVFPAREDDIDLLAAVAARQVDTRLDQRIAEPTLTVHSRHPNGEVTLDPEPQGVV